MPGAVDPIGAGEWPMLATKVDKSPSRAPGPLTREPEESEPGIDGILAARVSPRLIAPFEWAGDRALIPLDRAACPQTRNALSAELVDHLARQLDDLREVVGPVIGIRGEGPGSSSGSRPEGPWISVVLVHRRPCQRLVSPPGRHSTPPEPREHRNRHRPLSTGSAWPGADKAVHLRRPERLRRGGRADRGALLPDRRRVHRLVPALLVGAEAREREPSFVLAIGTTGTDAEAWDWAS